MEWFKSHSRHIPVAYCAHVVDIIVYRDCPSCLASPNPKIPCVGSHHLDPAGF